MNCRSSSASANRWPSARGAGLCLGTVRRTRPEPINTSEEHVGTGIPIAVYLLQNTDTYVLRVGFGIIVSLYACYMLWRPTLVRFDGTASSRRLTALIGFGGGLVGGLTAMPGAIPTIWCDMRGMPKNDQRGLVQPFIAMMQLFALALLLGRHGLSSKVAIDLAISLPALFAGSVLGIVAFRNINEIGFRRTILVILLFSGASLVFA